MKPLRKPDRGTPPDPRRARAADPPTHAQLSEQDLWSRLSDASSRDAVAAAWLELQSRMLGDVRHAVVVLGAADRGPYTPVAEWPAGVAPPPELIDISEQAMAERRGAVRRSQAASQAEPSELAALGYPVMVDERLCGVVSFMLAARSEDRLRDVMRQIQWGSAWLQCLVRRGPLSTREQAIAALDITALSLEHPGVHRTAVAVTTELATQLSSEWVAVGLLHGQQLRVTALSHSAEFADRSNLMRAAAAAMEESVDQQAVIVYPRDRTDPSRVTRAHRELVDQFGGGALCSVPLQEDGKTIGALTMKRSPDSPIDDASVDFCKHVAVMLGPVLALKRRDERWLAEKPRQAVTALVQRLIGPGRVGSKLTAAALAAVVALLVLVDGDYRVTADATLEGSVQRAITAPIDGYIKTASARAGDIVSAGDELSTLDDQELRLERVRWDSRREQYRQQHVRALANRDRAEVRILDAQIAQADAQLQLIDEQLARTRLVAPFSGVVVTGDLSQSLGAPVARGDVLFELAPLDSYRVILNVDEREIGQIEAAQHGNLALAGLPGRTLPLVVERLTPVSTTEDGSNYFRVEARLEAHQSVLRPGMEGVAKVDVGRRKLVWIWTHKLVESVRMWWWWWRG